MHAKRIQPLLFAHVTPAANILAFHDLSWAEAMDRPERTHPYGFPFKPYEVQMKLMKAVTDAIDARAVGLFESPTGTGKTLSIICATMSWILEHRCDLAPRNCSLSKGQEAVDDGEPGWVTEHSTKRVVQELRAVQEQRLAVFNERLLRVQSFFKKDGTMDHSRLLRRLPSHEHYVNGPSSQRAGRSLNFDVVRKKRRRSSQDDSEFVIQESACGTQAVGIAKSLVENTSDSEEMESPQSFAITRDRDMSPRLKVIFATRTHSQLAQFMQEVRRTSFAANLLTSSDDSHREEATAADNLPFGILTLGSRNVMCINETVRNLSSSAAVAERCNELLKQKSAKPSPSTGVSVAGVRENACGCPFKNETMERIMRDSALVQLRDVEDMLSLGEKLRGCPYFTIRSAISTGAVDIIGVPYSVLLHRPTREAWGLSVDENTIVVFDEAHNIVDAVNELNSAVLTYSALTWVKSALQKYQDRFSARLGPQTFFYISQIFAVVEGLLSLLQNCSPDKISPRASRVVTPSGLIFEAKFDNVNLFSLCSFFHKSRLSHKLLGYIDAGLDIFQGDCFSRDSQNGIGNNSLEMDEKRRKAKQAVLSFEAFLEQLNSNMQDAKVAIYYSKKANCAEHYLKYFLLRPGSLFSSCVDEARAILLVGGTLSPREALKSAILSEISISRTVHEFECDHVVPPENLLGLVVSKGPSGRDMEFTFRTRRDMNVIDELGGIVASTVESAPGGVVIFFASYAFMTSAAARWSSTGLSKQLHGLKPLFQEERGSTCAWHEFVEAVQKDSRRGGILTAVMGGRLSEGINFNDELGRVVMIVGMPYANAEDLETAEKLKAMQTTKERHEYLENSCLTIVNQALGRAVRHRADYATIILCDKRYSRPQTIGKLPRFVRQSLKCNVSAVEIKQALRTFFLRYSS